MILLDEPTTFLDLSHQLDVLRLVRQINAERGSTIVMVLHDLTLAARFSDRLIVLHEGGVLADGAPWDVITPEVLATAFGLDALVIPDHAGGFDHRDLAADLQQTNPGLRHVLVDGDPGPFTPWSAIADTALPPTAERPVASDRPALLLVSGGTTGFPKLIPRTHDDYIYNATASARLCGLSADDVYLVALPAAHNFPLACPGLLGAMSVGATTVFTTDPSPESAFATINRHGVTVTALVPALAKLWAQACQWEPEVPTTLRLLQVGGAKLVSPLKSQ